MTHRFRLAAAVGALALVALAVPASADALDTAANALKTSNVYTGDPQLSSADAASLQAQVQDAGDPIFVAVLPDVGGNYDALPSTIGKRTGRAGAYAVVAGHHFRAGSSSGSGLKKGQAASLASAAFDANNPGQNGGNIVPMLRDWVERVHTAIAQNASAPASSSTTTTATATATPHKSHAGAIVASILGVLVALAALVTAVVFAKRRATRKREAAEEQERFEAIKRTTEARMSAVADNVLKYDPVGKTNPAAAPAYSDATAAHARARAILDGARSRDEVLAAASEVSNAELHLSDVAAYAEGRDPVAERAAEEKRRAKAAAERERRARLKREAEEAERAKYAERMKTQSYAPSTQQTTTNNNYFGGGYYGGSYYAPGYYSDPFWNYLVMDSLFNHSQYSYDNGNYGSYDTVDVTDTYDDSSSSSSGGGDWSTSDSSSSSSSYDFGGGGDWGGGGGGYDSGSSDSGSSGGGDW